MHTHAHITTNQVPSRMTRRRKAPASLSQAVESRFKHLAAVWQKETWYCSSITEMSTHPAYQQIIGMGRDALPLIFRELAQEPDHWFWALSAITGEDPIPEADSGYVDKMTEAWLVWGKRHGYLS